MKKIWLGLFSLLLITMIFGGCKPEVNQNLVDTSWNVDSVVVSGNTNIDYKAWIESTQNATLEFFQENKYRLTASEGPVEGKWEKKDQKLKIGEDQFEIISFDNEQLKLKQEVTEEANKITFLFFLRKKANQPS
ncbi:MAG: hypothetical protein LC115_06860 [Bacteroidia bacterium]|nr:hypothetical protein [Bacteroidia bacterium]